jgi:hypothetical protein
LADELAESSEVKDDNVSELADAVDKALTESPELADELARSSEAQEENLTQEGEGLFPGQKNPREDAEGVTDIKSPIGYLQSSETENIESTYMQKDAEIPDEQPTSEQSELRIENIKESKNQVQEGLSQASVAKEQEVVEEVKPPERKSILSSWLQPFAQIFKQKEEPPAPAVEMSKQREESSKEEEIDNDNTEKEKSTQAASMAEAEDDLTHLGSNENVAFDSNELLEKCEKTGISEVTGKQDVDIVDSKLNVPAMVAQPSATTILAAEIADLDKELEDAISIIEAEKKKTDAVLTESKVVDPVLPETSLKENEKEGVETVTKEDVPAQPGPAPVSKEQVEEVLNNPCIPDNVKEMMQALYQQNQELVSRSRSGSITSEKKGETEKPAELDLEEYCQELETENEQLMKDNRTLNIENQKLKTTVQGLEEQLEAVAPMAEPSELVVKRDPVDMEALNLLGRLKRIWKDLMVLYIENKEIPNIAPISDLDFVLDQIDISVQILSSYVDTHVHAAQFPFVEERHLQELETVAKEMKRRISVKLEEGTGLKRPTSSSKPLGDIDNMH